MNNSHFVTPIEDTEVAMCWLLAAEIHSDNKRPTEVTGTLLVATG
jgi:hypothetical protein